jgi:hypothetical protein
VGLIDAVAPKLVRGTQSNTLKRLASDSSHSDGLSPLLLYRHCFPARSSNQNLEISAALSRLATFGAFTADIVGSANDLI